MTAPADATASEASGKRRLRKRDLIRRGALLLITGVALYILAPGLIEVFSSWERVREMQPGWLALAVLLELASFACLWILQKLAIRARRIVPVITSQLAGNAFGRIVPGGGAAAAAFQFGMLRRAGVPSGNIATGLTAVHLLTFGTLLALPILAIPAVLNATNVDDSLVRGVWIALGALVVLFAVGALFLATDGPLRWVGRVVQKVRNWIMRRREAMSGLPDRLIDERNLIRTTIGDRWWEALLTSIGRWGFDFGVLLAVIAALGASPSASLVLLAYVVANLAGMIPITPGGLGFVEAGLTSTLVLAGVSAGDAVVITFGYRLISFWLPLPFGGLAMLLHKRFIGDLPPAEVEGSGSAA
ncbi:MAG: lysylphosphatidylglycerol synthase transmembrane domain-containing protein [Solirubrobacterales bacterium]